MRRRMKIILIVCGVGILLTFIAIWYNPWIILPTKSSSNILTLVKYGYPRLNRITMRRYVNDVPINDYTLDLKIDLRIQQPQKYKLPKVNEGSVEINIELEDGVIHENSNVLTINYAQASDLYNQGLLVFLTTDYASIAYIGGFVYYDQYVYFISGEERTYYYQKAGSSEWSLITDAPQLKRFTREEMGYSPHRYGLWKENEWVMSPAKPE